MRRASSVSIPKWKQAVALMCTAYFLLVWCLPIFMLPFVYELPFVQEHNFWERLVVSSLGTVLVLTVLISLNPHRILRVVKSHEPAGPSWRKVQHWLGVMGGFVMFSAGSAAFSANLFGVVGRVLPTETYQEKVVLESVEFLGSRHKSVALSYRSSVDGGVRYLVLSKRLFDYPHFSPGDVLELSGERSFVGTYVSEFRRL